MISALARRSRPRGDTGAYGGPRHHVRATGGGTPRPAPMPAHRPAAPPVVTVFRTPDGRIFHAWCRQPLEFQGRRAGLELDFYCLHCVEHVPLPECVVSRIPLGPAAARPDQAAG